jgi:hypothetical protein
MRRAPRVYFFKSQKSPFSDKAYRLENSVIKGASLFLLAALFLAACGIKPVIEKRLGKKQNPQMDTSVLQAADLVGYDGKKLRRSADALIKTNTGHNKAIENAVDSK